MGSSGISVSDLTVTYRNGHTALHDVHFEIPTGTITGLVGINGSGKSTLFKSIMGFVPAAKGTISILGSSVEKALKNNVVAYVPQAEEVDWTFPVLVEDVAISAHHDHVFNQHRKRPVHFFGLRHVGNDPLCQRCLD